MDIEDNNNYSLTILRRLNRPELRELLSGMYIQDKMTLDDIAHVFRVPVQKIESMIRILKIPLRSVKESWDIKLENKEYFEITPERKQLLIGGVLGDGCVIKPSFARHYSYIEYHCLKQKDYCLWKSKIFGVPLKKKLYWESRNKYTDKNYSGRIGVFEQYGFTLPSHPYLDVLHSKFYTPKKSLPEDLLKELNPLGLAVWYLDDGQYVNLSKRKKFLISIHHKFNNFKEEEFIIKFFKEHFDLDCKVFHRKTCDTIRFNTASSYRFIEIVKPYIKSIPSMVYKIGEIGKDELCENSKNLSYDSTIEYLENMDQINGRQGGYNNLLLLRNKLREMVKKSEKLSKAQLRRDIGYMQDLLIDIG